MQTITHAQMWSATNWLTSAVERCHHFHSFWTKLLSFGCSGHCFFPFLQSVNMFWCVFFVCYSRSASESNDEWASLLNKQRVLHKSEINHWKDILSTSIQLMDEMIQALTDLRSNIDQRSIYTKDDQETEASKTTWPTFCPTEHNPRNNNITLCTIILYSNYCNHNPRVLISSKPESSSSYGYVSVDLRLSVHFGLKLKPVQVRLSSLCCSSHHVCIVTFLKFEFVA